MATKNTSDKGKGKAGRKTGSNVPKDETKAQRFVRLGKQRVAKALKQIESIGKLTGANYEHTPEQAEKIVTALEAAVKGVKNKFAGTKETVAAFDL